MSLREWRKKENLTAEELGRRCGAAAQTVRAYENGTRRPRPEVAKRIEAVTNGEVTAAELLGIEKLGGLSEATAPFETPPANSGEITIQVSENLLQTARELNVDAASFLAEGGRPALEAEVKRVFYEENREAIAWAGDHIRKYGSIGQRHGIFPTK